VSFLNNADSEEIRKEFEKFDNDEFVTFIKEKRPFKSFGHLVSEIFNMKNESYSL
jgi:hypothetical protein